jgi:nucleotide-binding universal stress UspA family protein
MEQTGQEFKLIPLKKILVALDLDSSVQTMADEGSPLTKTINAEVILLHVLSDKIFYHSRENSPAMGLNSYSNTAFFHISDIDGLNKAVQYFLDKIKNHPAGPEIQILIDGSDLITIILKTTENINIDIIVMNLQSRRWLEQILVGTNTAKVLNRISIPVFKIPVKEPDSAI